MNGRSDDESLVEQFACPVCFEYMDKKIYICANGHSICGGCNSKLSKCPICNIKLNGKRNISLEQAAKKVKEWKAKQEGIENAPDSNAIGYLKRKQRISLGSPIRTQPDDIHTGNQIQCPYSKCCYFAKRLLQLKIHLQRWHYDQLYAIKRGPGVQSERIMRVRLYWELNTPNTMFVLTASDTLFIVYILKVPNSMEESSHIINVLTVSNKTKMFKFTCGDASKFSMFYQGKDQFLEGIKTDRSAIETLKTRCGYRYYTKIFITRVAALGDDSEDY